MNTVLLILAALGLAFIVLAMAVFLTAARRNVSDAELEFEQSGYGNGEGKAFRLRSGVDRRRGDRRSDNVVQFPLTDDRGELVQSDRRHAERRQYRERRRA